MTAIAMLEPSATPSKQHNGKAFAELFTEDGVYHDVFYGAFKGREKIAEMIDDWFYRTATDSAGTCCAGQRRQHAVCAIHFQLRSTLPEAKGARAMFEGVAIMKLRDGKIVEYHEVANTAPAFVDMNFAPERIAKIVAKQGAALKARPEMRGIWRSDPSFRIAREAESIARREDMDCSSRCSQRRMTKKSTAAAHSSSACAAPAPRPSRCRSGPARHRASIRRSRCRRWRGG